jgi:threonine dehydrogenase-like Zn-dependent dehydrogenase
MPANPHVMQAIIQDGYGAPERVLRPAETAVPSIGAGDVLVRVRATSVNTPDWATVAGAPYIMRPGIGLRRPRRPVRGSDIAGVVEAVGTSPTWRPAMRFSGPPGPGPAPSRSTPPRRRLSSSGSRPGSRSPTPRRR